MQTNSDTPKKLYVGLDVHKEKTVIALLDATLRHLRKELADAGEVPPYVIFGDRTLRAMAGRLPESSAAIATLPGVGQTKIERYGKEFLAAIREFVHQNPETQSMDGAPDSAVKRLRSDTYATTLRLLNEGVSVPRIAHARGMAESTIEGHIVKLMEEGEGVPEGIVWGVIAASLPRSQIENYRSASIMSWTQSYSHNAHHLMRSKFGPVVDQYFPKAGDASQ